ncbi:ATP synthase subunit delta [Theileria orientalis]|uniref:ATP synthase subunit delta n=1 Tax=Theileria orientalis TaxID=68886 RepID=A0A976M4J7_THEOR|nr:ATP synthase subunit delta [Theileria orientalis]
MVIYVSGVLKRIPSFCLKNHNSFHHLNFSTKKTETPKLLEGFGIMGSYANALFLSTQTVGNLNQTCEDFRTFMTTPGLRTSEKMKFLREDLGTLTGAPLQSQTLNCLEMLFEQKRSNEILNLAKHFETLFLSANNQLKCLVQSADTLNKDIKEKIQSALKQRLGESYEPVVEYKVNPSLLGGLLVNVGDKVVDSSVSSKLERIQAQLLSRF